MFRWKTVDFFFYKSKKCKISGALVWRNTPNNIFLIGETVSKKVEKVPVRWYGQFGINEVRQFGEILKKSVVFAEPRSYRIYTAPMDYDWILLIYINDMYVKILI